MIIEHFSAWKQLEQRLADKQAELDRLIKENLELRDRLFLKNSLPVSGAPLTAPKAEPIQGWLPKKARLKKLINSQQPLTAPSLSEEELQKLREASQ